MSLRLPDKERLLFPSTLPALKEASFYFISKADSLFRLLIIPRGALFALRNDFKKYGHFPIFLFFSERLQQLFFPCFGIFAKVYFYGRGLSLIDYFEKKKDSPLSR